MSTRNWHFGLSASYTKSTVLTVVFNALTLLAQEIVDTNKLLIVCPVFYKLKCVLFLVERPCTIIFWSLRVSLSVLEFIKLKPEVSN